MNNKYGKKFWLNEPQDKYLPVHIYEETNFGNSLDVCTAVDSFKAKQIVDALNFKHEHTFREVVSCSGYG